MIVGKVVRLGEAVRSINIGDRVGIPWLGYTCGNCRYCVSGQENLCDKALFTGYTLDGGFAEFTVAHAAYCFPLSSSSDDLGTAPLLCAGLIGFRSYRLIGGAAQRLGIYGFGNAAHIITQVAVHHGRKVFAFTSPGDLDAQAFARKLGAVWAGDSTQSSPEELDAAIIFAPVGSLVPAALRAISKGGTVVCGGIHMSDIPSFEYNLLWGERILRSVANLTRTDGEEFLRLAPQIPIKTEARGFPLEKANEALSCLREGRIQGSGVLTVFSG
jgi:propanol-preferring alcohol dehydrogenase